ncbi:CBS and ACT domain-containing protein [Amphritea balenae]|uniref:CBS domain-containing protein n=1 Tax=Amphritea balenae TaxID=452629 RepID=A0A3P1SM95_9GAMM|nr:CBS and ACT domain-containing protein [Amphritea balenae]RRC98034.1 CBS domain-containing protein [Amphritea balenae]
MYIETIMTSDVLMVEENTKMTHLAGLMQAKRIRHIPVTDADGRLRGVLSHRDVQKASPSDITTLSAGEVNYLLSKLTAKDIMHRNVVSCSPKTLVEDAACLIREHTIGCLPVVENDKLVGIITSVDLLDFFLNITGCNEPDATRLSIQLKDQKGALSRLLACMDELGGYIVSVMTPQQHQDDGEGMRDLILRFTADDPQRVRQQLGERGYTVVTETYPKD